MIVNFWLLDRLSVLAVSWCLVAIALSLSSQPYPAGQMVIWACVASAGAWGFALFRGPQVAVIHGIATEGVAVRTSFLAAGFLFGLVATGMAGLFASFRVPSVWSWFSQVNMPAVFFGSVLVFLLIRIRIKRILSASRIAQNTYRIQGLPEPLLRALNEQQNANATRTK